MEVRNGNLQFDGRPSDFYIWREKTRMKMDAAVAKANQQVAREVARRTNKDHKPDELKLKNFEKQNSMAN